MDNPKLTQMTVLVVEPEKAPYPKVIESGLKSLQAEVGGFIEAIYPYEDPVAIICNEEGKLNGLPLNRTLRDENGDVYDIVAGTFLVTGLGEEDFCSLTPEQTEKYTKEFRIPERILNFGGQLVILKLDMPPEKRPTIKDKLTQKPPQEKKPTVRKSHDKEAR